MDARDKTKGLVALHLLRTIVDDGSKAIPQKRVQDQFAKIDRWLSECSDSLGIKRVSRGAIKDVETYSIKFFECRQKLLGDQVTAESMTQELIAADGLINWFSVKHDLNSPCWRYLKQTLDTLVRSFVKCFPEHEDWELYSKFDEVLGI